MLPNENDINSELLGLVTGRKRQPSSKSRVSELFSSSSDGELDLVEEYSSSNPVANTRKKSDEDEFADGFGPDLMGNDEDHQKLAAMTEVEREAVLYERAQTRLAKAERRELEKKMRALESTEGSRPSRGPSAAMEKTRRSLRELKARREKKRRHGSDSDYFEEGEEREEDGEIAAWYSRREDSSESDYEDESVSKKRNLRVDPSASKVVETIDLDLANKLLITRNRVAKWIFHPEFDDVVRGCLVRLAVSRGAEQIYRLVEIRKIVKYHRNYKVNEVTSNKAAVLKYGRSEKTFRLDVISNSEFTQAEFDRWIDTMKEEHQPMITKRVADNRVNAWRKFENRPLSNEVVSAMVAAKRELGSVPRNLVSERTMLLHLRSEALENKNQDEVDRIDDELAQLAKEQAAQPLKKTVDSRLEALAEINKRNRRMNVANVRHAELKGVGRSEAENRLDPFSRRKCQPTNFNAYFEGESAKGNQQEVVNPSGPKPDSTISDKLPNLVVKEEDIAKNPVDLFAAHNVDIEIDI